MRIFDTKVIAGVQCDDSERARAIARPVAVSTLSDRERVQHENGAATAFQHGVLSDQWCSKSRRAC